VVAFAVVSVYGEGQGCQVSVVSGIELIRSGLESWRRHRLPALTDNQLARLGNWPQSGLRRPTGENRLRFD
jgi:hypothetical protein